MDFVVNGYAYMLTRISITERRMYSNSRSFRFAEIERWEAFGLRPNYWQGVHLASRGSLRAERVVTRRR